MDAISQATADLVRRFNNAMNLHDVDALTALVSHDCIFEDTEKAPDGARYEGADAFRAFMTRFLEGTPKAKFTEEELIACGDRCIVRSSFDWGDGHVRGVQVIRIRDGKISEFLCYVKG